MGRSFDVCYSDDAAPLPGASDATATRVPDADMAQGADPPDATTNAGSPVGNAGGVFLMTGSER